MINSLLTVSWLFRKNKELVFRHHWLLHLCTNSTMKLTIVVALALVTGLAYARKLTEVEMLMLKDPRFDVQCELCKAVVGWISDGVDIHDAEEKVDEVSVLTAFVSWS